MAQRSSHPRSCLSALICLGIVSVSSDIQAQELPAFPGAEGFGTTTPGGRGGTVIEVTTLDPSGPGSFREAVQTEGPRIIIFRVGGTIVLDGSISLRDPFVTIAGQTAPGDGVSIRGAHLNIGTHDVIVRGLRFRIGDDPDGAEGANRDGLSIANNSEPPYGVVVDHCSVAWAIDENLSTWYECHDITVQWCITSEALHDSLHEKGPHSMGFLVGDSSYSISVHHNLFAHNNARNPLLKADTIVDVVNNLIYNWGGAATSHSNYEETDLPIFANHVANYYIAGVDSGTWEISFPSNMPLDSEIYVEGNIGPNRPDDTVDEWALCNRTDEYLVDVTHDFAPVTTWSAADASALVMNHAGAIVPHRDPVDERVVQSVRDGTGQIIDSQSDVGGWPSFDGDEPPDDSDGDGIPDEWEHERGLDPDDSSDATESSPVGYDWIEVYVNSLIPIPGNAPPVVDAGPDQEVQLDVGATLAGSASDDGIPSMPSPMSTLWSQQSGPVDATYSDATVLDSDVLFTEPGVYVFQLLADDYEIQASDTVTVTVSDGSSDGGPADAAPDSGAPDGSVQTDASPDGSTSTDGSTDGPDPDGDEGCACSAPGAIAPLSAAFRALFRG